MLLLYPDIKPYVSHSLAVDSVHTLHVEECGNPQGIPVVFLHGGPGAGCEPYHRRFFDPNIYRIVLFDQRGCGRSSPHAELTGNSTQNLVDDIERIRAHLGIERWVVFGGSWGSTLALVYAETHPARVLGLILRGIFLCSQREIRWLYQDGASRLFPDYWQDFLRPVPVHERENIVRSYYRLLTGDNELARMAAAKAWSTWEGRLSTLRPNNAVIKHFSDPYTALSLARIECHYFINDSFLTPDQILLNAGRLANIPGIIVHGRYDVLCPLENAWQLHQLWPGSELKIIVESGHSATEPGITDALINATTGLAKRLT